MGRHKLKLEITPTQKCGICRAYKTLREPRDRDRVLAVQLASTGMHTHEDIAALLCTARSTVQVWLTCFRKKGLAGLLDRKKAPGAPSALCAAVLKAGRQYGSLSAPFQDTQPGMMNPSASSEAGLNVSKRSPNQTAQQCGSQLATKALIEILHHKPSAYGLNRSNWTQQSLAEVFEKQFGYRPSAGTVGRLLKEAGFRWKKSKKVLTSSDPNYREKVELLLKTLRSLKPDEDVFFIDEMGPLAVKRHGGRCYTPKEDTPTHPQNQRSRGSITIYGALSAKANQVVWFYGESKDSAGMIDLIEILYNQQHGKSKIYLTWDAASWHRSGRLNQWVEALNAWNSASGAGPHIAFIPLPSNSQFLDVIEAVFSGMKRAVIHGSDYQSKAEMKTAISMHFRERNEFFRHNPKRVGKKMWEVDFFDDHNNIRWGNYREW